MSGTAAIATRFGRIGMGTMGLGGYFERVETNDADAVAALRLGIDLGLTLIDTAEVYGAGHAEELVRRAVEGRRADVCIATKFSPEHSDAAGVRAAAEASLRRLGTDYIDVYLTHWPNPSVPFEDTLDAMAALVDAGKVRAVGLSNPSGRQLRMARARLAPDVFVAVQAPYSLGDRVAAQSLLPSCEAQGLAFLAYSPLLEGRLLHDHPGHAEFTALARRHETSPAQLALAWLASRPGVTAIPKAARPEHVRDNAAAAALILDAAILEEIERLYPLRLIEIMPDEIEIGDAASRTVYRTLEEALANRASLVPSPSELAADIVAGETPRPVKVRRAREGRPYRLVEGRVRYWAWVIAHEGRRPIVALEV